jgi:hypothetical protein
MKGIFSGRQIKDLRSRSQRITRSQTASGAFSAITAKYGSVQDNAHYFHVGKGNWNKYSLENDKKRTGKTTDNKKEWAERPHKLDYFGIDTKGGKVTNKKINFSLSMLSKSGKLCTRTSKSPIHEPLDRNLPFKTFNGLYRDIAYTVDANTRTMSFKWDFSKKHGERPIIPLTMNKLKDVEMNMYAKSKTDAVKNAKSVIDIIYRGVGNINKRYIDAWEGKNLKGDELAKATRTGEYAVTSTKLNIDTKGDSKNVTNKKPRFPVTTPANGKMSGRKGTGLKLTGKAVTKRIPHDTHIPDVKRIKGYTFENVSKIIREPKLNQKQLVILRDIERMFKLDDVYSREFLNSHGYFVGVEDLYATGKVPKSMWLLNKISYRIDHPILTKPSEH